MAKRNLPDPPPAPPAALLEARVPRRFLMRFVVLFPQMNGDWTPETDTRLRLGYSAILKLLNDEPTAPIIRLRGSPEGFLALCEFVALAVQKDVNAGRQSQLSPLGMLLNEALRPHEFPPPAVDTEEADEIRHALLSLKE